MQISPEVIKAIREHKDCRRRLLNHFAITSSTLYNWLKDNEDDGNLTKIAAIDIISEELDVPHENITTEATV